MKVFFDCILTAGSPKHCSTTMQFAKLAEMLFAAREDIFIYWAIPKGLPGAKRKDYEEHPKIKYIEIEQDWGDRNVEYRRLPAEYSRILRHEGDCWDWDVMVTIRAPLIPNIRAICSNYRNPKVSRKKKILCIEDMMASSKKPTVSIGDIEAQDLMLVSGYVASDMVLCPAYHQKRWALELARDHLSASHVRTIMKNFREVSHLCLGDYPEQGLKDKFKYKGDRKLNVAFVGRLERFGTRLNVMNSILSNTFILHNDKVHPFICTITEGDTHVDTCAIEVRHPKQKEFWRICREEMDLTISFSVDVELNMSKLEPTLFGVPTIVIRAPWSEAMFGKDYPFMVKSENEAYAWVTKFQEEYDKWYEVFAEWWNNWFMPTYQQREAEDGMYTILLDEILNYPEHAESYLPDTFKDNRMVADVFNAMPKGEVINFETVLRGLVADKKMDNGTLYKYVKGIDGSNLTFSIDWHMIRLGLIHYHGVKDAGAEPGTFIVPA